MAPDMPSTYSDSPLGTLRGPKYYKLANCIVKIQSNFKVELTAPLELEFNYLLTPAGSVSLKLTERD